MYEYIKCPTCNKSLGEYYPLFRAMKKIKNEELLKKINTAPDKFGYDMDIKDDCLDIFELLNIKRICCKSRITMIKRLHDSLYEDYNE